MNTSKHRHDGGAYRRVCTMIAAHAKPGKDRSKAPMTDKAVDILWKRLEAMQDEAETV